MEESGTEPNRLEDLLERIAQSFFDEPIVELGKFVFEDFFTVNVELSGNCFPILFSQPLHQNQVNEAGREVPTLVV